MIKKAMKNKFLILSVLLGLLITVDVVEFCYENTYVKVYLFLLDEVEKYNNALNTIDKLDIEYKIERTKDDRGDVLLFKRKDVIQAKYYLEISLLEDQLSKLNKLMEEKKE